MKVFHHQGNLSGHRHLQLCWALLVATVSLVAMASPALAGSPPGSLRWSRVWTPEGTSHSVAGANAIVLPSGIVLTGTLHRSAGTSDLILLKYSTSGARLWRRAWRDGGRHDVVPSAAVRASDGGFVVCGRLARRQAWFVCKYDKDGRRQWVRLVPAVSASDRAVNVEEAAGTIYVMGDVTSVAGGADWCTVAYSSEGEELWRQAFDGVDHGADHAKALTVDDAGRVYVAGTSWSQLSGTDVVTSCYSPTATLLWSQRWDGPAHLDDAPRDVAVSPAGVVVAGRTLNTASEDGLLLSYGLDGTFMGLGILEDRALGRDYLTSVGIDDIGRISAAGAFSGAHPPPGGQETDHGTDYAIDWHQQDGSWVVVTSIGGSAGRNDCATDLFRSRDGTTWVTGWTVNKDTGRDVLTARFGPPWAVVGWLSPWRTGKADVGECLAVAASAVYVAGHSGRGSLLLKYNR